MMAGELAGLAGALISIAFSFVPKLKDWYDPLDDSEKRLVMLGALVAGALGLYALGCIGLIAPLVVCGVPGLVELGKLVVIAGIVNQTVWKFTPVVRERRIAINGG